MHELLQRISKSLMQKNAKVTCAESCTGGLLSAALTEISGSSNWFDVGFVTYSNDAKRQLLGVQADTLNHFGAVSLETVAEMATGALLKGSADYALAISGIAGPTGGSLDKPVGTVCFALANLQNVLRCQGVFKGDRYRIREQAVIFVLDWFDQSLQTHF